MQLVPTEVLEAIIDQASDNPGTLRQLSLTCATLLPRSRIHLFTEIVIRTVEQLDSSHEFLDSHPWLVPLVRKVTLFITHKAEFKRNILLLDVVPVHLFDRLPNLHAWTMRTNFPHVWLPGVRPSLSLHRSAFWRYKKYGNHIRSLELSSITFDSLSDFRGLVSAFTGIDVLTCHSIYFKFKWKKDGGGDSSPVLEDRNCQPLSIPTLNIFADVNSRAAEYLFACNGSKLKHLTLQLRAIDQYGNTYFEQMNRSLTSLSSLTLVVLLVDKHGPSAIQEFERLLHSTTTILEYVNRGHLTNVRVELKTNSIADLGSRISGASSAVLEACKQLEAALLTFPNASVLVDEIVHKRRVGEARIWTLLIPYAFPRLNKLGLLNLQFMTSEDSDAPEPVHHDFGVSCITISHDSKWVATGSFDGTIIVWDMAEKAVLQEWIVNLRRMDIWALALSPDSRRLLSAVGHTLMVWSIESNTPWKLVELEGHTDLPVTTCVWSPDGALIASASRDETLRVWDGHSYQHRDMLSANIDLTHPQAFQFSPNSRHLAWISDSAGCCAMIWTPLAGTQPLILSLHSDRDDVDTTAISFDHESRRIATAHGNEEGDPDACVVRIWDVATGAPLAVLTGHSEKVLNVRFSQDGRSLLSMSDDMSVRRWDCGTWSREQAVVLQDTDYPEKSSDSCFYRDGEYVASGERGGRVQLWRTKNGSCVSVFHEHDCSVERIAFSPNGQFLVSGDYSGIVHIRCISGLIR